MRRTLSLAALGLLMAGNVFPAMAQTSYYGATGGYGTQSYSGQSYSTQGNTGYPVNQAGSNYGASTGPSTGYPVQQAAPAYNNGTAGSYYPTQNGAAPVYNSGRNAQPYIPGRNAPSYPVGGNVQPYNYGAGSTTGAITGSSTLTPQQADAIRAQRDQMAQAAEAQYQAFNQQQQQAAQQQAMANSGASQYQGSAFGKLYANGTGQQKPPPKRRVIYKELNNPLSAPPRLFNLD